MPLISRSQIQKMVDVIVDRCQPRSAYLFGSYARDTAGPDSDIDFLVVKDHIETSRSREMIKLLKALEFFRVPVDVVVADQAYVNENDATPGTLYFETKNKRRLLYGS